MQLSRRPRILICRLSAIGDCIQTMPLAVALRDALPDAFIAWAVEGVAGTLIERHAAVDLALRLPRKFLRSPTAVWGLTRVLKQQAFDIAIDPQGLTKSALVAWLSGARRRIGFERPVAREISTWLYTNRVASCQTHVVDRYLELLQPLGVTASVARFDFPADAAAECRMRAALAGLGVAGGYAVVNPGAGWDSKLWPADRYAAVAIDLARSWGLGTVVVWAGDRERRWAEEIVRSSGGSAVMAPPTSLLELAAILRQARIFIGSDTGPLHMAAAVGTPCVGIYGPTQPARCGPYGQGHETLQARYQEGTSRQRRTAANEAMRLVTTEVVVQACQKLLSQPRAGAA
jgi:lipopolysaccharide heptosyltransferase I